MVRPVSWMVGVSVAGWLLACSGFELGGPEDTGPQGVQGLCDAPKWTDAARESFGGANAVLLTLILREADRELSDPEARVVLDAIGGVDELARAGVLAESVERAKIVDCPLLEMMEEVGESVWKDDVGYLCHLSLRCRTFDAARPETIEACVTDAFEQNEFGETMADTLLALDRSSPEAFRAEVRALADAHGIDKCPVTIP